MQSSCHLDNRVVRLAILELKSYISTKRLFKPRSLCSLSVAYTRTHAARMDKSLQVLSYHYQATPG